MPESKLPRKIINFPSTDTMVAIAAVVLRWAQVEEHVRTSIWTMLGVAVERGRLTTNAMRSYWSQQQLLHQLLLAAAEERGKDTEPIKNVFKLINDCYAMRNKIVHRAWWFYDEGNELHSRAPLETPPVSEIENISLEEIQDWVARSHNALVQLSILVVNHQPFPPVAPVHKDGEPSQ